MKSIFKVIAVVMLSAVIFGCNKETEKSEPRSSDAIKDPDFKKFVMTAFDKNGDYELSEEEMDKVEKIVIYEKGITSLAGIEIFINLKYLNCDKNYIKGLDLSKNTKLEELYCNSNRLTTLDVKNNLSLIKLSTFGNELLDYIVMSKEQNCEVGKDAYTRILYR